jgi:dGTPase
MTEGLRSCASDPARSRGRRHAEAPAPTRDDFQRDRDRIVHSTAFRRLVYKTQVFLNHEGDLFRTRLTHSLEVAQIARAIARELRLNEDLCETIALAHDLGHTPFGHAGQDALDECARAADSQSAGFEHNFQSLRVVDVLEQRYPDYDGLNLCFETREGILKHCSRRHALLLEASEPAGLGRRFLDRTHPSLEAQVCNVADEIAYNAHDIDDGVRSGLLSLEQLEALPAFDALLRSSRQRHPNLSGRRLLYAAIRGTLREHVEDVVETSRRLIDRNAPTDADAARAGPALIEFSDAMATQVASTKAFLRANLYRHEQVMQVTNAARRVIRDLHHVYSTLPGQMPVEHAERLPPQQAVLDYIAGMTDRHALREHARLLGPAVAAEVAGQMSSADAPDRGF